VGEDEGTALGAGIFEGAVVGCDVVGELEGVDEGGVVDCGIVGDGDGAVDGCVDVVFALEVPLPATFSLEF